MSTNGTTTADKKPNGTSNESVASKSQFLSHLQTYPLLTSALTTLTSHPYAATPLSLTHRTLTTLTPYATPSSTPSRPTYPPTSPVSTPSRTPASPPSTRASQLRRNRPRSCTPIPRNCTSTPASWR
ncbi:hypothetical protein ACLOAV_007768 [Pseudogymnoascus australis]